jgi:hypothetical protein
VQAKQADSKKKINSKETPGKKPKDKKVQHHDLCTEIDAFSTWLCSSKEEFIGHVHSSLFLHFL